MGTPITNRIRQLRFQHEEMTQQQLATRVGVTRQTVNAIEAGTRQTTGPIQDGPRGGSTMRTRVVVIRNDGRSQELRSALCPGWLRRGIELEHGFERRTEFVRDPKRHLQ